MATTTFTGPVRSEKGFIAGSDGSAVTRMLTASASLNFPSIAAASQQNLTISVPGAQVGDVVALGLPSSPTAGIVFNAFVSAAGTVTVRATNITASAVDPPSATYAVTVIGTT